MKMKSGDKSKPEQQSPSISSIGSISSIFIFSFSFIFRFRFRFRFTLNPNYQKLPAAPKNILIHLPLSFSSSSTFSSSSKLLWSSQVELKPRDAAEVPADLNQTDLPARTEEAKTGSGVGGARASSTKTEGRRVSGGGYAD